MAGKVKRIDVHSHVLPRELIELIRKNPRDYEMRVEGTGDAEKFVRNDKHGTPIYAEFFDADAKVEGMDVPVCRQRRQNRQKVLPAAQHTV